MYKIVKDPFNGEVLAIRRIADSALIPLSAANTDYQEYLKWIAEGNTPSPAESVDPQPAE